MLSYFTQAHSGVGPYTTLCFKIYNMNILLLINNLYMSCSVIPDHLSFVSEQNVALTPHLNYYNSILS